MLGRQELNLAIRVNIGCGKTPTKGWKNYDNSWSIRLAKKPILCAILNCMGLLSKTQREFILFAKNSDIQWADAILHIPEEDGTVDVVYSSHMIEHLEKDDAINFLKEARRVLKTEGVLRIAVPNIRYLVEQYLENNDADMFITNTRLTKRKPKTFFGKLKYLVAGDRHHKWMYDDKSLCDLLSSVDFRDPAKMKAGTTRITDSGALNLEERIPLSVFVEAVKK